MKGGGEKQDPQPTPSQTRTHTHTNVSRCKIADSSLELMTRRRVTHRSTAASVSRSTYACSRRSSWICWAEFAWQAHLDRGVCGKGGGGGVGGGGERFPARQLTGSDAVSVAWDDKQHARG
jgi:hypothetical protein